MTGAAGPPEGFRWVESAGPPPAERSVPVRGSRRWWWVAAVAGVVVVVVGAGVWWWPGSGGHGGRHGVATRAPHEAPVGTPKELLVSFPLDRQPVPGGWQISAAEIGLPAGVDVGDMFASDGDKSFFVTTTDCSRGCDHSAAWVYGIDTKTGGRLFAPIQLDNFIGGAPRNGLGQCFANGPAVAVCVAKGNQALFLTAPFPPRVWVIDLEHGSVTYSGPTDLKPGDLVSVGVNLGVTRLVAPVNGTGVYGIGPHAERTWLVPGLGLLSPPDDRMVAGIPEQALAVQNPKLPPVTDGIYRVFSAVDGTDLTPTPPPGTTLGYPVVYNEGFAYKFNGEVSAVVFYDTSGHELARRPGDLLVQNPGMPTVLAGGNVQIYTADGTLVTQFPRGGTDSFTTIGTKIYGQRSDKYGSDETWQQWDLLTGQPGPACKMPLSMGYIGSDGRILIIRDWSGPNIFAIDTATCQTVWETQKQSQIWQVGTGLIQRINNNETLTALHAPN